MPTTRQADIPNDQNLGRVLEAVREQQGLETIDQAAEFLLRRRMRIMARRSTGRRALSPVGKG